MKRRLIPCLLLTLILVSTTAFAGQLSVTFFDVGQGDAALVQSENATMLIDAGTNSTADQLVRILQDRGIRKIDYLVGTHPHEDHIGGLDAVIDALDIENIWMPRVEHDTKTFEDVLLAIQRNGYKVSSPAVGSTFRFDDAIITVLAPKSDSYGSLNDYSIVLRIDHGSNSFLFAADAETTSELEMLYAGLDVSADVLKVGHHGSATSSCDAFLDAVRPQYAVISCGAGNEYGHPHDEIVGSLSKGSAEILRTDELGDIEFISDGQQLTLKDSEASGASYGKTTKNSVNVRSGASAKTKALGQVETGTAFIVVGSEKNDDNELWHKVEYGGTTGFIRDDLFVSISQDEFNEAKAKTSSKQQSGTAGGSSATQTNESSSSKPSGSGSYIGNKNSKKFHGSGCHTLPKPSNQVRFESRDAAINAGYTPCKNCKP